MKLPADDVDDDDDDDKITEEHSAKPRGFEKAIGFLQQGREVLESTSTGNLQHLAARCNTYLLSLRNQPDSTELLAKLRSDIVDHAAQHPECHKPCIVLIAALRKF